MRRSLGIGHEPSLKRLAITSLILHLFLISVLIIPFRTGEREYRSYYVNLVEPVKVRKKARVAPAKKARKKAPAKKKAVAVKKKLSKEKALPSKKGIKKQSQPDTDNSKRSAEKIAKEIERLRAVKALSKKKAEREKTREIEVIRKRLSDSLIAVPGVPDKEKSLDQDSYYALIRQKIRNEWIYPALDTEGLEVIISIKIDSNGKVLSNVVEKSSGNIIFDRSAIKAVSKASPLPPPYVEMEIGFRFIYEEGVWN